MKDPCVSFFFGTLLFSHNKTLERAKKKNGKDGGSSFTALGLVFLDIYARYLKQLQLRFNT